MLSVRRLILVTVQSLCVVVGVLVFASASAAAGDANEGGCRNEALRGIDHSEGLPDCRAYEQVTPVEKDGGVFESFLMGVGTEGAPDLVVESFAAIAGLQDNYGIPGGIYSAVRTGSGWVTSATPPPASEYQTAFLDLSSPLVGASLDARSALWFERRNSWSENRVDLLVTRPGGAIEDAGTVTPPSTPPGEVQEIISGSQLDINVVGWSDDLSHIIYTQEKGVWPFDTTEEGRSPDTTSLYELVGTGNAQPMLVGLGNEGKLISNCGTTLGSNFGQGENSHNAVSAEGNVVFFTAVNGQGCAGSNELYARVDNGQLDAHTVAISEPSKEEGSVPGNCEACDTEPAERAAATFEGASVEGSKAFFSTEQPLLGGDSTRNIYEYDFDAPTGERIVRVTGGDSTVSGPTAEVQGHAVAISEDGSHVYFVAHGILTTTPNDQDQTAHAGANNLYVFERDAQYPAGRTAFIADLSASDQGLWHGNSAEVDVTPDGDFLVFASRTEHLTPDDTSTVGQVFEYDAQTGSLVRVSIGQNGYNDNGNTDIAEASIPQHGFHGSEPTNYWTHLVVSADGSYVFFDSTDGLTPQALNQKIIGERLLNLNATSGPPVYANNVYEYHHGNVYLISDGRDVSQSPNAGELSDVELVGTDAYGADVLFTTVDKLAQTDIDSNVDVYDARINGGFPAPASPSPCSADACQGPLSPAPILLSPGSEFQAGGNPPLAAPAPVAKPKAKKTKKKPKKADKKKATGEKAKKTGRAAVTHGHAHENGGR
jgi:Tol biopolymer transport system component